MSKKRVITTYPTEQYPFQVRNWSRFQHYSRRSPPWIKLYRDLLNDPEFHALDPAASKVLVMLWILAAEADGNLPASKLLAFRLRLPENDILSAISKLSHFIEVRASKLLALCEQVATPETETETETEGEISSLRSEGAPPADEPLTEPPFDLPDEIVPEDPSPPPAPKQEFATVKQWAYAEAKRVVGPKGGQIMAKLLKIYGEDVPRLNGLLSAASAASDPAQYLFGVLANEKKKSKQSELEQKQIDEWKPTSGSYPLSDARGFYIRSSVDPRRRLYLDGDRVQQLVGSERYRRGVL